MRHVIALRRLFAIGVFALGVALGLLWADSEGLLRLGERSPEQLRSAALLFLWIIGCAAVLEWLLPARPRDFGGGPLALAVAGAGLGAWYAWDQLMPALLSSYDATSNWMRTWQVCYLLALALVTRWLMMAHKRRAQAARDRRPLKGPFSLYLRPFELDRVMETWSANVLTDLFAPGIRRSLGVEEKLAEELESRWPLVAVGDSLVGAGKLRLSDEDWRVEVAALIRDAKLIFFVPGYSPGALWEAERLIAEDAIRKTFWFLPDASEFNNDFRLTDFSKRTAEALSGIGLAIPPDFGSNRVYQVRRHLPGGLASMNWDAAMKGDFSSLPFRLEEVGSKKPGVIARLREQIAWAAERERARGAA